METTQTEEDKMSKSADFWRQPMSRQIIFLVYTHNSQYSQKELAELMANSDTRYYFDGRSSLYYVTHYNFKEGDFNVRGYKWSSNVTLKLFYPGDHSVGKKEGSLITNYVRYSSSNVENHTVDFEIVKNDGKNVWAVFSYVENEKLYYGYLCQPL